MLNRLDIQARGQRRTITFDPARPVTIISAGNGGGKSTTLCCLQLALQKGITVNGETVASAPKIFDHLSSGEPVRISAAFDCGTVTKALIRDARGSVSSDWTFSAVPGGNAAEVQSAITSEIGDLARVDVADLLAKGPTDRRRAVLNLCQKHAEPWSPSELREAFDAAAQQCAGYEADGPAFVFRADPALVFRADPALGLLGSCEAHAKAAHEAVGAVTARARDLQKAIDKMAELNAASAVTGDAEAMATRIRELDSEIARLSGEVEAIGAANRSAEVIARRLNELAQLPAVERAQSDVNAAAEAYAASMADRAALVEPKAPVEPASISLLRNDVAEYQRKINIARADFDSCQRIIDRIETVIRQIGTVDHAPNCPTCTRPMDDAALGALADSVLREKSSQSSASAIADEATDLRDCIHSDLTDAVSVFADQRNAYHVAYSTHAATMATIAADITAKRRAHAEAEAMFKRCQSADAERADLRKQQAAIATGDADMLRAQIDGAKHERAETTTRRDAVLSAEATRRAYQTHIADRDEATASIDRMKVTAAAWREVVNQVAESAIAPFLDACNGALPAGWSMTFDLETSDFRVMHPSLARPIGISNLSGRERIEGLAAMVIAMGSTCGNKWRGLWLDDCDRIADGKWDGTPGMFAAFVERMADACRRGLVHQVIMATSRRLDGAERAAIERTGAVQVVEWGASTESDVRAAFDSAKDRVKDQAAQSTEGERRGADVADFRLANGVPEMYQTEFDRPEKPLTGDADARIEAAIKRVGIDGVRMLYQQLTGKKPPHTSVTARRALHDEYMAGINGGAEYVGTIETLIISTAARFPVKVRGAKDGDAEVGT